MSNPWKLWEGQVVDGKLPLLRYLGGSEHSAVFLTERHERGHSEGAAIKLFPASAEVAELQLARWKQAARLSHPHLIPLYEMGCCELRGVPLVYVVMESAEENLGQVLPTARSRPPKPRRCSRVRSGRALLPAPRRIRARAPSSGQHHGWRRSTQDFKRLPAPRGRPARRLRFREPIRSARVYPRRLVGAANGVLGGRSLVAGHDPGGDAHAEIAGRTGGRKAGTGAPALFYQNHSWILRATVSCATRRRAGIRRRSACDCKAACPCL